MDVPILGAVPADVPVLEAVPADGLAMEGVPADVPVLGAVPVDGPAMEGVGAVPRTEEPAAQVSGESMADAVFAGIPDTTDKVYSGLCPQGKTHLDLSCHQPQNCRPAHVLMRLFQSSYKQVYPFSFRICPFVHNGSPQCTKTVFYPHGEDGKTMFIFHSCQNHISPFHML